MIYPARALGCPAVQARPSSTGEPISLNLRDCDLKDFFRLIHEISGLDVVLDPAVSGRLTIEVEQVPWDQALDIALRKSGLQKQLEGNVLRIGPAAKTVGSMAPDFTLPDSDGSPVALSNYRGKWVLLQFMLITCPHCQEVDKVLKRLHQEYPGQLQPLDIAMPGHRLGALDDYKKELGLTYPVMLGDQKVGLAYFGGPVSQVPAFVLISPAGEIVEQRNAARESDRDFYGNTAKNLESMIRRAFLPK